MQYLKDDRSAGRILTPKAIPMCAIHMADEEMPFRETAFYLDSSEKFRKAESLWKMDFTPFCSVLEDFHGDTRLSKWDEEYAYFIEFLPSDACELKGINETSELEGFIIGYDKFGPLFSRAEEEKVDAHGKGFVIISALPLQDIDFERIEYGPLETGYPIRTELVKPEEEP